MGALRFHDTGGRKVNQFLVKTRRAARKRRPILQADSAVLNERVAARLRSAIVSGELGPGTRLPERALCTELKVSRTPLREAFRLLANEGLVEIFPNRGARVPKMDRADMDLIFEVIDGLESVAGRLACERATDAEITSVKALHRQMFEHFQAHRLGDYLEMNRLIHVEIVRLAKNRFLESIYLNLSNSVLFTCALSIPPQGKRLKASMQEHEQIMDALERRSGNQLAHFLHLNLANKRKALSGQF